MPDSRESHMRVSYKDNPGFFQKVQQSFCASLFGILLVIASFPVIYWNEGRAVQTALSLEEGLKQVVHLNYIEQVSPEYHDKLVHLTGSLQTDKVSIAVSNIVLCLLINKNNNSSYSVIIWVRVVLKRTWSVESWY